MLVQVACFEINIFFSDPQEMLAARKANEAISHEIKRSKFQALIMDFCIRFCKRIQIWHTKCTVQICVAWFSHRRKVLKFLSEGLTGQFCNEQLRQRK